MADAVGQAERIDALAAIEHDVGQPGAAHEHADHRLARALAARQRDHLPRDDVRGHVGARDLEQPRQRSDRVALRAKVERDQIGLAARQHRHRRLRLAVEIIAVVERGQRRLDGAVAAVDGEHGRVDPGDRAHRLANLVGMLDFVMEDVGMFDAERADARQLGEVARRLGIAQQGDPRPRHQLCAGPTDRPRM